MDHHIYKLVVFIDDDTELKSIDIVPWSWITYDAEMDSLVAKYMSVPISGKQRVKLLEMVKNCSAPNDEWPNHRVEICGGAKSYNEAEKRLKALEHTSYAYTEESETQAETKSLKEKQQMKIKCAKSFTPVNELLDAAAFNLTDDFDILISNSSGPSHKDKKNKGKTNLDNPKLSCAKYKSSGKENSKYPDKEKADRSNIEDLDILEDSFCQRKEQSSTKRLQSKTGNQHDDYDDEESLKSFITRLHRSLSKQIAQMHGQVIDMKIRMDKMSLVVDKMLSERDYASIADSYNGDDDTVSLPCSNFEDFESFEEKWRDDSKYRNKIKRDLERSIDKKRSMVRNAGEIIRNFLSQNVAIGFTTVKQVPGKKVFKSTALYTCIEDVMLKAFDRSDSLVSKKQIQEAVQAIFNNVKDWDGHRKARSVKE